MQVAFPFRFDARGRTAETSEEAHVRDMVEQVLFTAPGERVNRPAFGSGIRNLVFAPASPELATATQFLIQGALQEWLGNLIAVDEVQVEAEESILRITVVYTIRRTQQQQTVRFERGGLP